MSSEFRKRSAEWKELAGAVLKKASGAGVQAEVSFTAGETFSVKVRKGKLEDIRQSGSTGASMRVFKGARSVSGSTSRFGRESLGRLLDRLAGSVGLVDEDEANGLPDAELLYRGSASLDLYDEGLHGLGVDRARDIALECEQAALKHDPRITNSSGASVSLGLTLTGLYNSRGLEADCASSQVSLSVSPIAEDQKGEKYSDWWFSQARHLEDLDPPAAVGSKAGERCVAGIGAAKIPTCKARILFAPETAMHLVQHVFESISGDAVYKGATFLGGKEGSGIASGLVTIIDDPLRPRGASSAPFDAEGVATSRQVLVDKGGLRCYPCDSFAARRLKRKSTGHAASGKGITSYNLYLERGKTPANNLLGELGTGLFVTAFIGFGFNMATGDFSRGVRGFWVEDGKIVKPVQEVTVSDNLGTMLENVVAVGDDLTFRFGTDSPSLLVSEMAVSGS